MAVESFIGFARLLTLDSRLSTLVFPLKGAEIRMKSAEEIQRISSCCLNSYNPTNLPIPT